MKVDPDLQQFKYLSSLIIPSLLTILGPFASYGIERLLIPRIAPKLANQYRVLIFMLGFSAAGLLAAVLDVTWLIFITLVSEGGMYTNLYRVIDPHGLSIWCLMYYLPIFLISSIIGYVFFLHGKIRLAALFTILPCIDFFVGVFLSTLFIYSSTT